MRPTKRVLFRCDADRAIGGGHVMRCSAIAHALYHRGWHISFATAPTTFETVPALRATTDFTIHMIDSPGPGDLATFTQQTTNRYDIAIVDSYTKGAEDERALRRIAHHVVAIDDLADRDHAVDLLIDTNVGRLPEHYRTRVAASTQLLIGPAFAPIRAEFKDARTAFKVRPHVARVVLAFGLTDVGGITARVAEAILPILPSSCSIDAIIGPQAEGRIALDRIAAVHQKLVVHVAPPNVAQLLAASDLVIGAGGVMMLERCCVGVPSLSIVLADNQRPGIAALARAGATIEVTNHHDPAAVADALRTVVEDFQLRTRLARAAAQFCDGDGLERIADALENLARRPAQPRAADPH